MLVRELPLQAVARWMASYFSCESIYPRTVFHRPMYIAKSESNFPVGSALKKWDLLVVADGQFLAGIEFKSQVGSFGNNYNNRTEEAIGSATDLWAAYREGAFKPSARPWLGYLMLLEETPESMRSVRAQTSFQSVSGIQGSFICQAV